MPYATTQNFIDAFGQEEMVTLTNLEDAAAEQIGVEALQRAQARASATIDSIIRECSAVRAAMPLTAPYPEILIHLELDLCRYFLDTIHAREDVRLRYEDAMKQLRMIGRCEMSLGFAEAETPRDNSLSFVSQPKYFTPDSLRGFL